LPGRMKSDIILNPPPSGFDRGLVHGIPRVVTQTVEKEHVGLDEFEFEGVRIDRTNT